MSRLLAYAADLLVISVVVYAAVLGLVEFAIDAATPFQVEFKSGHGLVLVGSVVWAALYFGSSWVIFARSPG